MIGKIQRVPLRDVWKHEALDLTCCLEENIDVISEQIGISLKNVEREKGAGTFWVDLMAEDEYAATVIIENQLAKSDHDHLGKVITYLVAMEAKTAIWITPDPRPEHIAAVSWLNESTPAYVLPLQTRDRLHRRLEAPAAPDPDRRADTRGARHRRTEDGAGREGGRVLPVLDRVSRLLKRQPAPLRRSPAGCGQLHLEEDRRERDLLSLLDEQGGGQRRTLH